MVSFEVVGVHVQLDQVSVGKGEHGVEDSEDHAADSVVDEREVGDVSGASKVKFQDRRVDERNLGGSDL